MRALALRRNTESKMLSGPKWFTQKTCKGLSKANNEDMLRGVENVCKGRSTRSQLVKRSHLAAQCL